jgi:hypothetical protein
MSIQLYKPTSRMTGMAISFQASDMDESLYVSLIKQASWNETTKRGSFIENRNKPGFSTVIKFNQIEAGSMVDAIERFYAFTAFHNSADFTSQITLGPADGTNPSTFVFKVHQTNKKDTTKKSSFFIPISFGEARMIKEYLIHYLHKAFSFKKADKDVPSETPQPESPEPVNNPAPEENSAPPPETPPDTGTPATEKDDW